MVNRRRTTPRGHCNGSGRGEGTRLTGRLPSEPRDPRHHSGPLGGTEFVYDPSPSRTTENSGRGRRLPGLWGHLGTSTHPTSPATSHRAPSTSPRSHQAAHDPPASPSTQTLGDTPDICPPGSGPHFSPFNTNPWRHSRHLSFGVGTTSCGVSPSVSTTSESYRDDRTRVGVVGVWRRPVVKGSCA